MSVPYQGLDCPPSRTAPGLRQRLLETLECHGVEYCLRNGSDDLHRDTVSETEHLDLLVARDETHRFDSIVTSLGFKRTLPPPAASHRAVFHFIGWDVEADSFVHLHAYSRIITGERQLNANSLPVEEFLPPRHREVEGVPVPDAPAEITRRYLHEHKTRERLASGGAIIAVVGADATGKSTVLSHCSDWLAGLFDVKTVHAGKPPATWLTLPFATILALARRVARTYGRSQPAAVGGRPDAAPDPGKADQAASALGLKSLAVAFRAVVLAWERRQLLVRCGRLATGGQLVFCDRYPSDTPGAMDSPRLRVNPSRSGFIATIYNRLARTESRLYGQIPPPDVVLRMSVSIETAKHRNRNRAEAEREDEAYVESRHRQNVPWRRAGTRDIHDIDANGALADTLQQAKEAIWRST